ncbi:MAG: hypothetical protein ACI9U0_001804 [Flavobacteriales bacterium]|jgi:hypothetical protein|tara:strand:- start:125 stop:661 length:537 start_codon:yes stop_codon:yes gene_type:complete
MRSLFLLFFFSLSIIGFSQKSDTIFVSFKNKIDTLIKTIPFEPNLLFETTWLKNSPNIMQSRGCGLSPASVNAYCTKERAERAKNSIYNISVSDSSFEASFKVVENSCHSFICDFEIENDSTINFIYHNYGNNCGSDCVHNLTYTLGYNFMLDQERKDNFQKIKYITLNGQLMRKIKY